MTPEQQMHEEEYARARSRYEDASMEKRRAENEIAEIQNRRRSILNEINQLQAEKKKFEGSQSEITKSISSNNTFDDCLKDSDSKLTAASQGFLAISSASHSKLQDLNVVFNDKNTKTKSSITSVFSGLKTVNQNLENKITELKNRISQLETEEANGRNREHSLANYASEQASRMNSAAADMAYHRRHMS